MDENASATSESENEDKHKIKMEDNTLQKAVAPALIISSICGFFPVKGLTSNDPSKLCFSCKSWRTIYSYIVVTCATIMGFMSVIRFLRSGIMLETAGDIMFFGGNALGMILFINLASNWKELMVAWRDAELTVPPNRRRTKLKISIMIVVITFLSLFEHLSADANTLTAVLKEEKLSWKTVSHYFQRSYKMMFDVIPFNLALGILFALVNLIDVIVWNYMDLLIIILSIALADLFHSVTLLFEKAHDKFLDREDWRHLREVYNKLHSLTGLLNDKIALLVLLSVGSNLYFICLQLLNSLRPMKSLSQRVYFYSSFGYLLARTLIVCLSAAAIPIEASTPLKILYDTPSQNYNTEIQRLIIQIQGQEVALSGCYFFTITRNLVITILGTIITYEIVLVQFNSLNEENNSANSMNKTLDLLNK